MHLLMRLPSTFETDQLVISSEALPFKDMLLDSGKLSRQDIVHWITNRQHSTLAIMFFNTLNDFQDLCNFNQAATAQGSPARLYWASNHGHIIGTITPYWPPSAEEEKLPADTLAIGYHILESQRRQGHATALIRAFQKMASASGFTRLLAETNTDNPASSAALKKNGFTPLGLGATSTCPPDKARHIDSYCFRFAWLSSGRPATWADWPYPA